VEAAFQWFRPVENLKLVPFSDRAARPLLEQPGTAVIGWITGEKVLLSALNQPGEAPSFLDFSRDLPVWSLDEGWFDLERKYRWTHPVAALHLRRPAGATKLLVRVNLGPVQQQVMGGVELEVVADGRSLGKQRASGVAWHDLVYPLPDGSEGMARIELRVDPPFRPPGGDNRQLGAAVAAVGFR
jgi:hypothetical protein